jgi:hypothetical protein
MSTESYDKDQFINHRERDEQIKCFLLLVISYNQQRIYMCDKTIDSNFFLLDLYFIRYGNL